MNVDTGAEGLLNMEPGGMVGGLKTGSEDVAGLSNMEPVDVLGLLKIDAEGRALSADPVTAAPRKMEPEDVPLLPRIAAECSCTAGRDQEDAAALLASGPGVAAWQPKSD